MAHWRYTYQPVKFFFMDARFGLIILLSLVHVRLWTVLLDICVILLAWYIDRTGMTFMGACRAFRRWCAGNMRPALPNHYYRYKADYQRRRLPWEKPPLVDRQWHANRTMPESLDSQGNQLQPSALSCPRNPNPDQK